MSAFASCRRDVLGQPQARRRIKPGASVHTLEDLWIGYWSERRRFDLERREARQEGRRDLIVEGCCKIKICIAAGGSTCSVLER